METLTNANGRHRNPPNSPRKEREGVPLKRRKHQTRKCVWYANWRAAKLTRGEKTIRLSGQTRVGHLINRQPLCSSRRVSGTSAYWTQLSTKSTASSSPRQFHRMRSGRHFGGTGGWIPPSPTGGTRHWKRQPKRRRVILAAGGSRRLTEFLWPSTRSPGGAIYAPSDASPNHRY